VNIKDIARKFLRGADANPEKAAMDYCYAHGFTSGKNFQYNSGFPIDANWPWLISVGDDVTLASNVRILAHDASTAKTGVRTKVGIVRIGNNVFIGADSIVLCNTRIGDNVIIGAGSVVTHDVPSNSVYAGNPAKYICSFEEYQKKHQENQKTHPIFREHTWKEWPDVSAEEKAEMRKKLEDTFGYL
jgi:maltose O-acetyltransferase